MGQPSNPSYGNALAAPGSSSSPQTGYSSSSPTNSLTDDQMLGLVLEMHSMMQVLMQNSQRPPSTQYSATSNSNSFPSSSPAFASSSSSYSSPASSNNAPILPSSQSSFSSSSSSSFTPSTSNSFSSSPTTSSFGAASSPDSYGNPLGKPLSNNGPSPSSSQAPSSTRPPVQSPAAVSASSSYGSARAPPISTGQSRAPTISSQSRAPTISTSPSRAPTISSNSFSLPQSQATNDPLVKAASTGTQVTVALRAFRAHIPVIQGLCFIVRLKYAKCTSDCIISAFMCVTQSSYHAFDACF